MDMFTAGIILIIYPLFVLAFSLMLIKHYGDTANHYYKEYRRYKGRYERLIEEVERREEILIREKNRQEV